MNRISAAASRSLPSDDLRRYSYKLSYRTEQDGKQVSNVCRCKLPERPDAWSDTAWRKYRTAMARLPCKVCNTEPVVHAPPALRSSLPQQQGSTTSSIMKLLSKGKKHYRSTSKHENGEEAEGRDALEQQQQEGEQEAESSGAADDLVSAAPFCATAPSSAVEATDAAAVFPGKKKAAAPWDEEG